MSRFESLLDESQQPGASELAELLLEMLGDGAAPPPDRDGTVRLERLKEKVFRLRVGEQGRILVLKRFRPVVGQTDRLVAERWLPALGLGDRCPRFLGAAAQRAGQWVWHVYEDIGDDHLGVRREPWALGAAVDLLGSLHARAAAHPLLPEIRWRARDYGARFFTASLGDAITALETFPSGEAVAPQFSATRSRLLERLYRMREDAGRRVRVLEEAGGPDTMLHGDLWPQNVFVSRSVEPEKAEARLIDWDHVGVGSFSYDLSTFLYRSAPEERPWIMRRYRDAARRGDWQLPGDEELNLLFHTAEVARCVYSILFDILAVRDGGARWALDQIMDYERWLAALHPPLPD